MNPLIIEATEFTPKVWFEPNFHIFEISGYSRPENVSGFYAPVVDYIQSYEKNVLNHLAPDNTIDFEINLKLKYFNSASSKYIIDIIDKLVKLNKKGLKTKLNWYYDQEDEVILEAGEDLSEILDVSFHYIEIKN